MSEYCICLYCMVSSLEKGPGSTKGQTMSLWYNVPLFVKQPLLRWLLSPLVPTKGRNFLQFLYRISRGKTDWLGINQVNFKCIHDHSLWPPRRRNLEEVEIAKKHPMAIITMQYSRQISWKEKWTRLKWESSSFEDNVIGTWRYCITAAWSWSILGLMFTVCWIFWQLTSVSRTALLYCS